MKQKTILHIEDDPALADLVRLTFKSFGFKGEILHVSLVEEAIALLEERERKKAPIALILSDMHLPDGKGLDMIKHIKANPAWTNTPVIILSGEGSPDIISEAYALGANCYLSKIPRAGRGLDHFRSLYQFWLESALLPEGSFVVGIKKVLCKAARLRARIAHFYIELSKSTETATEQESFWIEQAMAEGNLSGLLTFLQGLLGDEDIPQELTESYSVMQSKVEMALIRAEKANMNRPHTEDDDVFDHVLGLLEVWDEALFNKLFGVVFPMNHAVAKAFKSRAAMQLEGMANYIHAESNNPELVQRANLLKDFSDHLRKMAAPIG